MLQFFVYQKYDIVRITETFQLKSRNILPVVRLDCYTEILV